MSIRRLNKTCLIGNLCDNPKFTPAQNGVDARAWFKLAVDRPGKDAGTDYFSCLAWGRTAENIAQHCGKGKCVYVEGPLRSRSTKRADNTYDNEVELQVRFVQFGDDSAKQQGAVAGQMAQGEWQPPAHVMAQPNPAAVMNHNAPAFQQGIPAPTPAPMPQLDPSLVAALAAQGVDAYQLATQMAANQLAGQAVPQPQPQPQAAPAAAPGYVDPKDLF